MTQCRACLSKNIKKIGTLKPYNEFQWEYEIFECMECGCRFSSRDYEENYHEVLHKIEKSPYEFHYEYAKNIKANLHDLEYCEKILRKRLVFSVVLDKVHSLPKEAKILEVGCSSGYITAFLHALGYKNSVGVDIATSAIEFAKGCFGDFYYENVDDFAEFDLIFHSGLIGCVDSPKEFLYYYISRLTKNGMMLFNAPNVQSPKELNELWVDTPPPDLVTLFDKKFFEDFLELQQEQIVCNEISSFTLSQQKYRAKLFGKEYVGYPANFKKKQKLYTLFDRLFYKVVYFLDKVKLLKRYHNEYGLIVEINSL
jgi:2-polyprenyl-3-methyl-5-hydroxy-6-metoxy-1,4-benzoquinol methylase